jgi:hypothetical protein
MAISMRIQTPQPLADRLTHLVALPDTGRVNIADLEGCAQGNLLAPWSSGPSHRLYGIEISEEQVDAARARLPHADITRSPFESLRIAAGSISLAVGNPPYVRLENGKRAEYVAITLATHALCAGGVTIQIIPARQLDGVLANHLARNYTDVRCWRFPDDDPDSDESFQKYTQIVIAGVKRATVLDAPDPGVKAQVMAWKYDNEKKTWAGGAAPPVIPDAPIADPYPVPVCGREPEITVLHADDALLLERLSADGLHHGNQWRDATEPHPLTTLVRLLMPPVGPAHISALILSGLLDGDILETAEGRQFVLTTWAVKTRKEQDVTDEQREAHVVEVVQNEPEGALSVLWMDTGEVETHIGSDAYAFLAPYLPVLTQTVLGKYEPVYQLDPARWEVRVALTIAQDKQLPGQPYPGLAPAQMHRPFALRRAFWEQGQPVLLNGEAGVGKTRQLILLSALLGYYWQHRQGRDVREWGLVPAEFDQERRPRWLRRLRQAWKANPRLPGDAPRALPVIVSCPKRVTAWQQEFATAFPQAQYWGRIESMADIRDFFAACATSDAPIVVGIIAHSTKHNRGLHFAPGVERKATIVEEAVLDPPEDLHPHLEPIRDGRKIVAYKDTRTSTILTHHVERETFFCPHCGHRVEAIPAKDPTKHDGENAEPVPVTDITYFLKAKRRCSWCDALLWQFPRTEARQRTYGSIGFARWSQFVDAGLPERPTTRPRREQAHVRLNAEGQWDWTGNERINPFDWLHRHYRRCWGLTIIDESHNGRSGDSDIGRAFHLLWN